VLEREPERNELARPNADDDCALFRAGANAGGASLLSAVPAKKKHHGAAANSAASSTGAKGHTGTQAATGKTAAGKTPTGKAATGQRVHSRVRARVHYYAGPRLDPAHKAALIEEISAQLKDPRRKRLHTAKRWMGFMPSSHRMRPR